MKKSLSLFLSVFMSLGVVYADRVHVMVFSDPHVLHSSLVPTDAATATSAFESGLLLSEYSQELFDAEVASVLAESPDVLLIPGDLSNNGDSVSHRYVAQQLQMLVDAGTEVFIIPGNHDINEPGARTYTSVETGPVTVAEFRNLYHACGYDAAVAIHSDSLSYMAYIGDSLALICMNSSLSNIGGHKSAGGLTEEVLSWAEQMAAQAIADGRYPYGMTHHQLLPHFDNQLVLDNDHVANCDELLSSPSLEVVQARLVMAGITTVFTGHAHIQSIKDVVPSASAGNTLGRTLYDISSNSTSSYGAAVRHVVFEQGTIDTMYVDVLPETAHLTVAERDSIALRRTKNMANSVFGKVTTMMSSRLGVDAIANVLSNKMRPLVNQYMLDDYAQLFAYLERGDEMRDGWEVSFDFAMQCLDDFDSTMTALEQDLKNTPIVGAMFYVPAVQAKWDGVIAEGAGLLTQTVYSIVFNCTEFNYTDLDNGRANRLPDSYALIHPQYAIPSTTTALSESVVTPVVDGVYTIDGRRLSNEKRLTDLPQGVYIVDGQKVVR